MRPTAWMVLLLLTPACGDRGCDLEDEVDCDGADNDCDGYIDEGLKEDVYEDVDGDGYGSIGGPGCPDAPGTAPLDGDCDDGDATAYPEAPELCDGVDNDCDGDADEGLLIEAFEDLDGDGYGARVIEVCELEPGLTEQPGDCDDSRATVHPGAQEICDNLDNDCDDAIDLADADDFGRLSLLCFDDLDQDGYGDSRRGVFYCATDCPERTTRVSGDCDDSNPDIYPLAPDSPGDGVDGDCDALDCARGEGSATCPWSDTWTAARSFCQQHFTDMAPIHDAADVSALVDTMYAHDNPMILVGLSDAAAEGTWVNVYDDSPLPGDFWSEGNPNNANNDGSEEDCAGLQAAYDDLLNDVSCDFAFNGVLLACVDDEDPVQEFTGLQVLKVGDPEDPDCEVSWTLGGAALTEGDALLSCPDCSSVFQVHGEVDAVEGRDTEACAALAQAFSETRARSETFVLRYTEQSWETSGSLSCEDGVNRYTLTGDFDGFATGFSVSVGCWP
ncbi:MAG: hypothetical protein H6741_18915 [Alphaproteobacteria bacterium]|nr:hypothetical protein [Alphaproteobacteria bacterium]MCB9794782.1 hypothetical protein [Alphaproteobacteria bacterium]